jgi:hypothetical protein
MLITFTSIKTEKMLTYLHFKSYFEVQEVSTKKIKKFNISNIY